MYTVNTDTNIGLIWNQDLTEREEKEVKQAVKTWWIIVIMKETCKWQGIEKDVEEHL